jgi:hypothetical protein
MHTRRTLLVLALSLLVLVPSLGARAVTLTTAQRNALKADILANSDALAIYNVGNLEALAALYNANASPAFTVWKSNVSINAVGKAFSGTELAGLTSANQTRLQTLALYLADGVNPSIASNRAFFDDVFSGASGVNTRAALLVLWKRAATRLEKVFATGTGSDASPGVLVLEGALSPDDLIGL